MTLHPFIDKDGKLKLAKNWPDKPNAMSEEDWNKSMDNQFDAANELGKYLDACSGAMSEAIEVAPESVETIITEAIEQADKSQLDFTGSRLSKYVRGSRLKPGTVYPITVSGRIEEQPTHTCKFDFGRDNCPKDLDECRVNCAYNKVAVYVPDQEKEERDGSKLPECRLTDQELIDACDKLITQLCKTGGHAFTMRVPVDMERDSDMILCELVKRFQHSLAKPPAPPEQEQEEQEAMWREIGRSLEISGDSVVTLKTKELMRLFTIHRKQ